MAELEVQGLNQLMRTMKAAGQEIDDLKRAHYEAAQTVAQWAAVRAPRRTGRLGGTVAAARQARRARVRVGAVYGGPVHTGGWPTPATRGNPFVLRAADETEPSWSRTYETELRRVCATVKGV